MHTKEQIALMSVEELMYNKLRLLIDYGILEVFEDDGTVPFTGKCGRDELVSMLKYYEEREQYEYCSRLKRMLNRYDRSWPVQAIEARYRSGHV